MKGLKKVLLVAAVAAPFAAQAELKSIDDATMASVSGQSGLVIEAGFGSVDKTDLFGVDWSNAGITIEAFKWEVDAQLWDNTTNDIDSSVTLANPGTGNIVSGGFIANDIAIAGSVDMTIDAVGDGASLAAVLGGGALSAEMGGIGITFANSDINFRVGDMGTYVATGDVAGGQLNSFGSIEIIGMNIDGLELVVRGN